MPQQIYTVGVEEEYQIIDPVSRDLSSSAIPLLQEAQLLLGEAVQYEMQLSQIEISTPICQKISPSGLHQRCLPLIAAEWTVPP